MSDQDQPHIDDESAETPADALASVQVSEPAAAATPALDLDGIERDLADVEVALSRLDAGTYWTDEVTGQPLGDEHLAEHPTARRA